MSEHTKQWAVWMKDDVGEWIIARVAANNYDCSMANGCIAFGEFGAHPPRPVLILAAGEWRRFTPWDKALKSVHTYGPAK